MRRFDALTQLTETPQKDSPPPTVPKIAPKQPVTAGLDESKQAKNNHEIMNSGNLETLPSAETAQEKPTKYSTLIDHRLLKKIKLYAAQRELQDYEVIERALLALFEKHQ